MLNAVPCTPDEAKELIKSLRSLKLSFTNGDEPNEPLLGRFDLIGRERLGKE